MTYLAQVEYQRGDTRVIGTSESFEQGQLLVEDCVRYGCWLRVGPNQYNYTSGKIIQHAVVRKLEENAVIPANIAEIAYPTFAPTEHLLTQIRDHLMPAPEPAEPGDTPDLTDAQLRVNDIIMIMESMPPKADEPDNYTASGAPKTEFLESALDTPVSAADRDEAWEQLQAKNASSSSDTEGS